jgi:hypothetical protein
MSNKKLNWAIYRIHYGLDFLKQSIDSIIDSVDKVFVIYSLEPWVVKDTVNYLGDDIPMPKLHEDVVAFMEKHYSNNNKVVWFNEEVSTPKNQFRNYYDICVKIDNQIPTKVLFMEPDMVYLKSDIQRLFDQLTFSDTPCLGTTQIELWKDNNRRIPQRPRIGPVLWQIDRMPQFSTHFGPTSPNLEYVAKDIQNYNFGFCLNAKTMLYKHLTAINFSAEIGDSIPSQEWYRDKWLTWTPATRDIEISEKWKHLIPKADIYNMSDEMKEQMRLL